MINENTSLDRFVEESSARVRNRADLAVERISQLVGLDAWVPRVETDPLNSRKLHLTFSDGQKVSLNRYDDGGIGYSFPKRGDSSNGEYGRSRKMEEIRSVAQNWINGKYEPVDTLEDLKAKLTPEQYEKTLLNTIRAQMDGSKQPKTQATPTLGLPVYGFPTREIRLSKDQDLIILEPNISLLFPALTGTLYERNRKNGEKGRNLEQYLNHPLREGKLEEFYERPKTKSGELFFIHPNIQREKFLRRY